jgi:hypothetical protein
MAAARQTGGWIGGLVGAYDRLLKVANDSARGSGQRPGDRAQGTAGVSRRISVFDRCVKQLVKGMGSEVAATQLAADTSHSLEFARSWLLPSGFMGHYAPDA